MITAKQLKDKYEKDLKELQSTCKHPETKWYEIVEMHGNLIGVQQLQCKICWDTLLYKSNCIACKKEYTSKEMIRIYSSDQLCSECSKKGKWYCWEHRVFYNDRNGCPECGKGFDEAEKQTKKRRRKEKMPVRWKKNG